MFRLAPAGRSARSEGLYLLDLLPEVPTRSEAWWCGSNERLERAFGWGRFGRLQPESSLFATDATEGRALLGGRVDNVPVVNCRPCGALREGRSIGPKAVGALGKAAVVGGPIASAHAAPPYAIVL